MLDNNCKLFMTFKKKIVMVTSKQEEENLESSDDKETECDSMMLKTFYHIWVVT